MFQKLYKNGKISQLNIINYMFVIFWNIFVGNLLKTHFTLGFGGSKDNFQFGLTRAFLPSLDYVKPKQAFSLLPSGLELT